MESLSYPKLLLLTEQKKMLGIQISPLQVIIAKRVSGKTFQISEVSFDDDILKKYYGVYEEKITLAKDRKIIMDNITKTKGSYFCSSEIKATDDMKTLLYNGTSYSNSGYYISTFAVATIASSLVLGPFGAVGTGLLACGVKKYFT